ncbi:MAG: cysteine desulfurase [Alphaproteobacteria bacterium]|nr:cysteine desulfurase [Alphaproteobacteria bacterium]
MQSRIYLDWNATTPLRSEARAAMAAAFDLVGNPSSIHAEGRQARHLVEDARLDIARSLGARPHGVIFTSSGTEANALALTPQQGRKGQVSRLLVSAIEHASVLAGGRFPAEAVSRIPVNACGIIDLDALAELLAAGPPALVSIMAANNETGAIQPISAAARLVHDQGGLLHVDAIQAFGRIPYDINVAGADLSSLSGHKIGGPKGVGALILADGLSGPEALLHGGGQEQGRRAGTENVAGIAGFAAAAVAAIAAREADMARLAILRRRLESALEDSGARIFSQQVDRLPNTTLFALPGLQAQTAVINFDLDAIALSSGAACSSGKVQSSHVLVAMGCDADGARGALRISLGGSTTEAEIDRCIDIWHRIRARHARIEGRSAGGPQAATD